MAFVVFEHLSGHYDKAKWILYIFAKHIAKQDVSINKHFVNLYRFAVSNRYRVIYNKVWQ